MKTLFLFACLVLLTLFCAKAQNQDSVAIKKYYEENTIWWNGSSHYIKSYQSFPLRDLKNEIRFSPDAIDQYKEYRRDYRFLRGTIIASTGLLVAAILVKDQKVRVGLLAGSIIATTISIPIRYKSSIHLGKAIWLHNRDVLLK